MTTDQIAGVISDAVVAHQESIPQPMWAVDITVTYTGR